MRYRLEFREAVREYLRNLPLTRSGRIRVNAALIQMVAEVPDSFRSDPANRPGPSSPYYHFSQIFKDDDRLRTLYVVVDDSTAAYGVLRIVYADCQWRKIIAWGKRRRGEYDADPVGQAVRNAEFSLVASGPR